MKIRMFKCFSILLVLCFIFAGSLKGSVYAESNTDQNIDRILFLSSYSYSWETVPLQIEGIQEALGDGYVLNYEFMDTKNTYYSKDYKEFYDALKFKLQSREEYDAIIVGDDAALNFVMLYQNDLFPEVPIVFEGIDNIEFAKKAAENPYCTGIVEKVDYKKNIELAEALFPDAKNLFFILDNAENGVGIQEQLKENSSLFSDYNVQYINSADYTKEELCSIIGGFTEKDIVFCISMSRNSGNYIYTEEERYQILNTYSKVPMFRVSTSGVGKGVLLGGYVVDHKMSGMLAGKMVKEAINQGYLSNNPIDLNTPNMYYFDENVITKFHVNEKQIPTDAVKLNEKPNFIHKNYRIILVIAIAGSLILLVILLHVEIINTRRYEDLYNKLIKKNEELLRTSTYKSEFLSNMSHEIRTPMNAIIGMTKLAQETTENPKTEMYLKEIDSSSQYMLSVLNDVLDMSRIDSGKFKLSPTWCYATDLILPCVIMMEPQMNVKGIKFQYPGVEKISNLQIYVDALRTKQIFMNLLNNAYKFTPEGGTVSLEMANLQYDKESSVDQITISDTGCGMSEEFLTSIFQPFEREQNDYTINIQGTGLGLALVKKIVDAMGGSIKVESKLGCGSKFIVRFPYKYRIREREEIKEEIPVDDEILVGKRILLVDDHPMNRKIASALLQEKQMIIEEATDGEAAIKKVSDSPLYYYDVILMDIRMPKCNGLDATRAIRKLARKDVKDLSIIAMKANAFDEDVKMSLEAGMNMHLAKPINPNELYEALEKNIVNTIKLC